MESTKLTTTVAVIGGGPAGVAAAIWLHQFGIPTVLLESASTLGGLQRKSPYSNNWVPGLLGKTGQGVAAILHEHAVATGCTIRLNSAVAKVEYRENSYFCHLPGQDILRCQFIVVATGTVPKTGGFAESEYVGIGPGLSMERIEMKGKRVAILGGGDNAFDIAAMSLQKGAASLKIFSRHAPKVQPLLRASVPPECVCVGPFVADQKTMTVEGEEFDVFGVQFGYESTSVQGLTCDKTDGYISVNRLGETSIKNVYACGDVTNYWQPCVSTACAHGIQVAKSISSVLWAAKDNTGAP